MIEYSKFNTLKKFSLETQYSDTQINNRYTNLYAINQQENKRGDEDPLSLKNKRYFNCLLLKLYISLFKLEGISFYLNYFVNVYELTPKRLIRYQNTLGMYIMFREKYILHKSL